MRLPKIALLLLLLSPISVFGQGQHEREIADLKTKIVTLTGSYQTNINQRELNNYSKLARYQSRLLIKVFTYEIYLKLRRIGIKRNKDDIEKMVQVAFDNSWIFQDLGKDHSERFIQILQWVNDESGFNKNCISSWKKGQYIKRMNITIKKDSTDYGAWQINGDNIQFVKIVNYLYESGVITFKVKKIRTVKDLMDIPTSCTARCLIETDRKARGWEWRHLGDKKFNAWLHTTMATLEHEGSYNRAFVEKYYNITPFKKYSYTKVRK